MMLKQENCYILIKLFFIFIFIFFYIILLILKNRIGVIDLIEKLIIQKWTNAVKRCLGPDGLLEQFNKVYIEFNEYIKITIYIIYNKTLFL